MQMSPIKNEKGIKNMKISGIQNVNLVSKNNTNVSFAKLEISEDDKTQMVLSEVINRRQEGSKDEYAYRTAACFDLFDKVDAYSKDRKIILTAEQRIWDDKKNNRILTLSFKEPGKEYSSDGINSSVIITPDMAIPDVKKRFDQALKRMFSAKNVFERFSPSNN